MSAVRRLLRCGRARPAEPWIPLDYDAHEIRLVPTVALRARSVEKEPETVAWIEQTLRSGDVLYDVGANIGAYALVAAVVEPAASVYAFEPGFETYAALCRNVVLNEVGDRLTPLPVALGARTELAEFAYRRLGAGNAQHHVGPDAPFEPAFTQRLISLRMDDLGPLLGLPEPTHLKLDVDGAEPEVLAGGERLLATPRLREVQVEVQPGDDRISGVLLACGFTVAGRSETPKVVNVRYTRAHQSTAGAG